MKALYALFLLGFVHLCVAVAEHPEVTAGNAIYQAGQGDPVQLQRALEHFLVAARDGDPQGQFQAALIYDSEEIANTSLAIYWYEEAAKGGNIRAFTHLGDIYVRWRGVRIDRERAAEYYRQGVAAGDPIAQSKLAVCLLLMMKTEERLLEAAALLAAVEHSNDPEALRIVGAHFVRSTVEETSRQGVKYLLLAAEMGNRKALGDLAFFLNVINYRSSFLEEEQQWIRDQIKAVEEEAKAFVRNRLEEVAPLLEAKRYDEALAHIKQDYALFIESIYAWRSVYGSAIWREAQVGKGRSDPEWGWRLFEWASHCYDKGMPSNAQSRIIVRGNIGSWLLEVGRIGKLREINERIIAALLELDGIDVEQVFSNAVWQRGRVAEHSLPLRYTPEMKPNSSYSHGHWFSDGSMSVMLLVAKERMLAGDWRKAVFLCDWIETWAAGMLADERTGKRRSRITDVLNSTLLLRAQIYEVLYYTEHAESTYKRIIGIAHGAGAYGGRSRDGAMGRLALLLARTGRALELDLDALEALAQKQKKNLLTAGSNEYITRLAAAMALDARGQKELAREQVDEFIDFARNNHRPLVLLEALQTSVDLLLANGNYEQVQSQLFEALELARSLGLRVMEPALYSRYVAYLQQTGDYGAAFMLQVELIDLLKRLEAVAALPQAEALQEVLYGQYVDVLGGRRERGIDGETAITAGFPIDLQPVRTVKTRQSGGAVESVFVLFNRSRQRNTITLSAKANANVRFLENGSLLELSKADEALPGEITAQIEIEGRHHQPVRVRFASADAMVPVVRVQLSAVLENVKIGSELEFRQDGEQEVDNLTVIDAHLIESSPFYSIPVYHYFSGNDRSARKGIGLRAVASAPTRIEAYDERGRLLFIDAQGNGNFTDRGDLLATRNVSGVIPLLEIDGTERLVEFRYKVHNPQEQESVTVQIQRSQAPQIDLWHTVGVNEILLGPAASAVIKAN